MAGGRKPLNLENRESAPYNYSEIETTLKSLQKPAACNFILSMVERYIRSLSSPDLVTSSLPNKEELISLIDTHILMVPSGGNTSDWPFTVFEELELLELLRGQVEERQLPKDIQLALFDALFGLGNDSKVVSQHRLSLLGKLVSLSISGLGNGTVLHCTSYWIELYPLAAVKLAQDLYCEFCELLPNAMDSIIQLGPNYPSLVKLLTLHLTSCYPIYSVTGSPTLPLTHKYCPPLQLLHLICQWLVTNPDCLTVFPDTRDVPVLVRSVHIKRLPKVAPLSDVTQWVVLEPLIPNEWITNMTERQDKPREEDLVREYRTGMSKLHANLLTYLLSLGNAPVHVAMTGNNLSILAGRLMEFQQKVLSLVETEKERRARIELALDRFAQVLQLGLSVGIINCNADYLSNIVSSLPKNRLLNIVCTAHRNTATNSMYKS